MDEDIASLFRKYEQGFLAQRRLDVAQRTLAAELRGKILKRRFFARTRLMRLETSTLSNEDLREIKLFGPTLPDALLAMLYGVTATHIRRVRLRRGFGATRVVDSTPSCLPTSPEA